MEELHVVSGIETLAEFKALWADLTQDGWQFVAVLSTTDEGDVLIFKRSHTGLGDTGAL